MILSTLSRDTIRRSLELIGVHHSTISANRSAVARKSEIGYIDLLCIHIPWGQKLPGWHGQVPDKYKLRLPSLPPPFPLHSITYTQCETKIISYS